MMADGEKVARILLYTELGMEERNRCWVYDKKRTRACAYRSNYTGSQEIKLEIETSRRSPASCLWYKFVPNDRSLLCDFAIASLKSSRVLIIHWIIRWSSVNPLSFPWRESFVKTLLQFPPRRNKGNLKNFKIPRILRKGSSTCVKVLKEIAAITSYSLLQT